MYRTAFLIFSIINTLLIGLSAEEELKPELKELMEIVELEKTMIERLEDGVAKEKLDIELKMRADSIEEAYAAYIERYPKNVFGHILYGKFLRKTDKTEQANEVFLDIHEDNPDIPVVNQQLALYASETGAVRKAFEFFQRAIKLDPEAALFHYQYGEFLYTFKLTLIRNALLSVTDAEDKMHLAFKNAYRLNPLNRDYKARFAESYFDIFQPNWNDVLPIWDELISTSSNLFERDVFRLQKARVLVELKQYYEASELIKPIKDPSLMDSKKKVLKLIEEAE